MFCSDVIIVIRVGTKHLYVYELFYLLLLLSTRNTYMINIYIIYNNRLVRDMIRSYKPTNTNRVRLIVGNRNICKSTCIEMKYVLNVCVPCNVYYWFFKLFLKISNILFKFRIIHISLV